MAAKTRRASPLRTSNQQLALYTSGIEGNKGNITPLPGTTWYGGKTILCPLCSYPLPDHLLACPVCTEAAGNRGLREFQYHPLREVAEGRGSLVVRVIGELPHLQMFGAERTFCSVDLSPGHRQKGRVEFGSEKLAEVCPICRGRVEKLIEEARKQEAREDGPSPPDAA